MKAKLLVFLAAMVLATPVRAETGILHRLFPSIGMARSSVAMDGDREGVVLLDAWSYAAAAGMLSACGVPDVRGDLDRLVGQIAKWRYPGLLDRISGVRRNYEIHLDQSVTLNFLHGVKRRCDDWGWVEGWQAELEWLHKRLERELQTPLNASAHSLLPMRMSRYF